MRLYIARWPDGSAYLVQARSLEELADVLDEAGDPGACEVFPFKEPFALEIRPNPLKSGVFDLAFADCCTGMRNDIARIAFPELNALLDKEEWPSASEWLAAAANEDRRPMRPTRKWYEAVCAWLDSFAPSTEQRAESMRITLPKVDQ